MSLLDFITAAMVRGYTVGAKREADHVMVDALHLQSSLKTLEEAIVTRTQTRKPDLKLVAKEENNDKNS